MFDEVIKLPANFKETYTRNQFLLRFIPREKFLGSKYTLPPSSPPLWELAGPTGEAPSPRGCIRC